MSQVRLRRRAAVAVVAVMVPGIAACRSSSPAALTSHHPHARYFAAAALASARTKRVTTATVSHHSRGVTRVTAHELGASWHHGCPVGPRKLRAVRIRYWGFDHHRHVGVLIVNVAAVTAVREAFARIAHSRFPIRRMRPVSTYDGSDNRSMAADNTSAFNCRYAVANGPKSWSEHAFGDAIDIDPRENPYRLNGKILPPDGAHYIDRSRHRRGMVLAHGPVVAAFTAIGWGWGGRWSSSPDYQHFSVNGR